jgi:hypothetical protein
VNNQPKPGRYRESHSLAYSNAGLQLEVASSEERLVRISHRFGLVRSSALSIYLNWQIRKIADDRYGLMNYLFRPDEMQLRLSAIFLDTALAKLMIKAANFIHEAESRGASLLGLARHLSKY